MALGPWGAWLKIFEKACKTDLDFGKVTSISTLFRKTEFCPLAPWAWAEMVHIACRASKKHLKPMKEVFESYVIPDMKPAVRYWLQQPSKLGQDIFYAKLNRHEICVQDGPLWIERLGNKTQWRKKQAMDALKSLGIEVLETVLEALEHKNEDVRRSLVDWLIAITISPELMPRVLDRLKDLDWQTELKECLQGLVYYLESFPQAEAVEPLRAAIKHMSENSGNTALTCCEAVAGNAIYQLAETVDDDVLDARLAKASESKWPEKPTLNLKNLPRLRWRNKKNLSVGHIAGFCNSLQLI